MITMEQKIDIILRYIASEDETDKAILREKAIEALNDTAPATNNSADTLDDIIETLLSEIGIPCHLLGYAHITRALKLIVSDDSHIHEITKKLYPAVAERADTTPSRVERGIRHAIEVVWSSRDTDNANAILGNTISIDKGKPTNAEFLACCAKEVKRRMKKAK